MKTNSQMIKLCCDTPNQRISLQNLLETRNILSLDLQVGSVGTSHPHHDKPVEAQVQSRRRHHPHRHLQRLLVRPRQHSAVKEKYNYFDKLIRGWKYFRGKRVRVIIRKSCQVHNYNCLFSKLQSLQINRAKSTSSAVAKRIECDNLNGLPTIPNLHEKEALQVLFLQQTNEIC